MTNSWNSWSKQDLSAQQAPLLEIELDQSAQGCITRFIGDLTAETLPALWSLEPILMNESRVSLGLSRITTIDSAGLEATLILISAINATEGYLTIGSRLRWN
jgi:ABC-type transporter Mla MlaB component